MCRKQTGLTIITILLLLSFNGNTQSTSRKLFLKVGDRMPDYTFKNVLNYSKKELKTGDFRNKLLLLDFWSTSCSSCIESWPKLLALQEKFKDKIQIVIINPWQDETVVKRLFEKRKLLANLNMTLPSVNKDPGILKYFDISSVPHVAWIDIKGIIQYITDSGPLTFDNISSVLNNEKLRILRKLSNDEIIDVKFTEPLFINNNGEKPKKIFSQSVFGKSDDRVRPNTYLIANEKEGYFAFGKCSIRDLYRLAYSDRIIEEYDLLDRVMVNRVSLEVKDSANYVDVINGEYRYDKHFIYQLLSPLTTREQLQKDMQSDLKRYIGLNAKWEKRKVKCLVFSSDDTTAISTASAQISGHAVDDIIFQASNISMKNLIQWMERATPYSLSPYPIIDETGLKGKVGEIKVETDVYNHKALDKALFEKYKLHFTLQEREINVLVVSEPEGYKFPYDNTNNN